MNCCNANGQCDQGADCAIRKRKELDATYIYNKQDTDPYVDTIGEFRTLLAVLLIIVGLVMLAFAIWGK